MFKGIKVKHETMREKQELKKNNNNLLKIQKECLEIKNSKMNLKLNG